VISHSQRRLSGKISDVKRGQNLEAEARATSRGQDYEVEAKNNYEKAPNNDK